jgi:hypothetical protein
MGFTLPETVDFERPPDGTYMALCYRIVDLGTQETTYKGEAKKQHQITLSWELPDERMKDGRPFSVAKRYTFSASENSNFRKALESWRGKKFTAEELRSFELDKLLGKACILTIQTEEKEGKTYTNIVAISPPMKGAKIPTDTINESFCFAMQDGMFNPKLLEKMHEKLQETIKKSPEWQALSKGQSPKSTGGQTQMELDDEIPFNFNDRWLRDYPLSA